MLHRPLFIAVVWIIALSVMVPASLATGQVITDLTYDLGSLSEPELLVDWAASGTGVRSGIRVTTTGDFRTYTHSSLSLDGEAFLMDTVFSGEALSTDDERGARMWVRFGDATLPPILRRHAEARLYREAGTVRIGLFNSSSAPTFSPLGSLPQDWTSTTPRVRVRIRYQEVAGIPTIFFVAEDSTQWTPDLSGPLTPDATNTFSLPVNGTNFPPVAGLSEFGFGNFAPGNYYADYETVRIIRSSESDTVLPAAFALNIPTLAAPGYALLVVLLAIGGWVLLARFKS